MLQMRCPNCKGVINSQFLADVSTYDCGQCKETIPVKDLFITTRYFTISREDFINKIFRFQRLLQDVEKERGLMEKSPAVSHKSKKSMDNFYLSLQELLVGARDNFRMEIPCDLYVEVNARDKTIQGKLLNLSTEGCSIELLKFEKVPSRKSELKIEFAFPDLSERICTAARVVWTKDQSGDDGSKNALLGVTFTALDSPSRSSIWNYILGNTLSPYQPISEEPNLIS